MCTNLMSTNNQIFRIKWYDDGRHVLDGVPCVRVCQLFMLDIVCHALILRYPNFIMC